MRRAVKSDGQVLREYRLHPEHKFNGPDGQRCRYLTRGLLQRRPVYAAGPVHLIGKEANKLDEVQAGLHGHLTDVVTNYGGSSSKIFRRLVLPVLASVFHDLGRWPCGRSRVLFGADDAVGV